MEEIMKIFLLISTLLFLTGCATPCKFCHETKEPDIEQWQTTKLNDGYVEHKINRTWIHYLKR